MLDTITDLKQLRHGSPEFEKWHRDAKVAIHNIQRYPLHPIKNLHAEVQIGAVGSSGIANLLS